MQTSKPVVILLIIQNTTNLCNYWMHVHAIQHTGRTSASQGKYEQYTNTIVIPALRPILLRFLVLEGLT